MHQSLRCINLANPARRDNDRLMIIRVHTADRLLKLNDSKIFNQQTAAKDFCMHCNLVLLVLRLV